MHCATWGKSSDPSEPQFPQLRKGQEHLLLRGSVAFVEVKCL